jgi:DNA-binding NarL/FixJ family response regulator
MVTVFLVDDHLPFRQPLAGLIELEPDIAVVAQAGSIAEARATTLRADVALVDLRLPDGDGCDVIRHLRSTPQPPAILVLTGNDDPLALADAVDAGASGILQKTVGFAEIALAIRRVAAGEAMFSTRELMGLLRVASRHRADRREALRAIERLTVRERDVLQALAEGMADKEIATCLDIGVQTARTHMVNILSKLDVDSRLQAVLFAIRHGLVRLG